MRICKFDEVTSIYGRGGPGTTSPLIFEQPQAAATPLAPTPSVPATGDPSFVVSPAPAPSPSSGGTVVTTQAPSVPVGYQATGVVSPNPTTTTRGIQSEGDPAYAPSPSPAPSVDPSPADPGPSDAPEGGDYGGWSGEGSTGVDAE